MPKEYPLSVNLTHENNNLRYADIIIGTIYKSRMNDQYVVRFDVVVHQELMQNVLKLLNDLNRGFCEI